MTATPTDRDQFVIDNYSRMLLRDIAREFGVTPCAVQQRAVRLIREGRLNPSERRYNPPWTEEDDEYLADHWGNISDKAVARHLGRTVNACKIRATRQLHLSRCMQFLTSRAVAEIFSIDSHAVIEWIEKGWLQASRGPFRIGRHRVWRIQERDLERFIQRYPQHYDRTRIERGTYWRNLADKAWAKDPWLTAEEAAAWVGVCTDTILRHCNRGWLAGEKVAGPANQGCWRIRQSELANFRRRH